MTRCDVIDDTRECSMIPLAWRLFSGSVKSPRCSESAREMPFLPVGIAIWFDCKVPFLHEMLAGLQPCCFVSNSSRAFPCVGVVPSLG